MAPKKPKIEKPVETAVAVMPPPRKELVLEGDPEQQLQFAQKAAKTLMQWVAQKPNKVMIRGEQYLEFGDWQILARFYGATVGVEWSRSIDRGWEARSVVTRNGEVIASAEAMCTRAEKRWSSADEYAVRSMAQTRASAKALRQAFGWVAELAGMKSTPAEEMPPQEQEYDQTPVHAEAVPVVHLDEEDVAPAAEPNMPTDIVQQKRTIIALAKKKEPKLDARDKKELERVVADHTGLALVEGNFPAIIRALNQNNG